MIDYIDIRIEELRLELEGLYKENAANIWTYGVICKIAELKAMRTKYLDQMQPS